MITNIPERPGAGIKNPWRRIIEHSFQVGFRKNLENNSQITERTVGHDVGKKEPLFPQRVVWRLEPYESLSYCPEIKIAH